MSRSVPVPLRALIVVVTLGLIAASFALTAAPAGASVPVPVITSISAGYQHTCAVTADGGAKCWGLNAAGQLGDGTRTDRKVPVDVKRLTSGVAAISAGYNHTCALTTSGGVKCWGANTYGQLGNGTTIDSKLPMDVMGLTSGVTAISSGIMHTCALTEAGGAKCWGAGYLGDGTDNNSDVPVDVSGLTSGVAAISVGADDICALTTSGGVKCWGSNFFGELGDGTMLDSSIPVDVSGLTSGVATISVGELESACVVTTAGGAKCWGRNFVGELGDGTDTDSNVPVDVFGLTLGVRSISVGEYHTCATSVSGPTFCWGNNDNGQFGNGTTRSSGTAVPVSNAHGTVVAVYAGAFHTCALTIAGRVRCWGTNFHGQLGDGTTTNSPVPADVFGPTVSSIESSVSAVNPITTAGQISVTTGWAGADPYATITSYEAQVQINGGDWSDVTLAGPSATGVTLILSPGNRYNFQIRDTDSSGHASVWSPETTFTLNGFQETMQTYSGTWVSQPLAGAWGGAVKSATESNASSLFRFHGPNAVWIGTKGPRYGSADVYLDGVYVTTVDCNAASTLKRQTLFSIDHLRSVKHTLEIVNQATAGHPRIDIDGFVSFRL